MSLSARQLLLQQYRVLVYDRATPAQFSPRKVGRVLHDPAFDFEAWVTAGQHVLRFDHRGLCLLEVVTDQSRPTISNGLLSQRLCVNEEDYERQYPDGNVQHFSTVQIETLSPTVFDSMYHEHLQASKDNSALIHPWEDEGGKCLSIVDVQRAHGEVRCEAFHMIARAGLVISTISVFELLHKPPPQRVEIKPRDSEPFLAPPRHGQGRERA